MLQYGDPRLIISNFSFCGGFWGFVDDMILFGRGGVVIV